MLNEFGTSKNGAGYIYRGIVLCKDIKQGDSLAHERPASWTVNPVMAVGWVGAAVCPVILRMKVSSNVRKLYIGSFKPPIDMVYSTNNPTTTEFAPQAEVLVATTNLIVTRVQNVPISILTGVNAKGFNHKRLPNCYSGTLVKNTEYGGTTSAGFTPGMVCSNNSKIPTVSLVDVKPTPRVT